MIKEKFMLGFFRGLIGGSFLMLGCLLLQASHPPGGHWLEVCTPFVDEDDKCNCKDSCKSSLGHSQMCNKDNVNPGGNPTTGNCACVCVPWWEVPN